MSWDILNIIGTVAFAISGAIVAMEEEYDIFGVYILGLATAFGGGAIRNLLIGVPVSALWEQGTLFTLAIIVITLLFFFPNSILKPWKKFGTFTDAVGLGAFAIQGALYATAMNHPLSAVVVAAVLTGSGGGMIRDVLARRKPVVFLRSEIYALWAVFAGLVIGLGIATSSWHYYLLLSLVVILRMVSYHYRWKLPYRPLSNNM
ncbi:trimeric intracellular cation channel family protein [Bacillus solimangrovi]|uniref:Glycine transporter domain-containing protein n=1 Tax=Bacillus solimangrovi TaxID=1305675 RepID=A0A1E5LJ49_9BACI|nr:trimeric intracellular cation channel family protein [Bacillus solimangrovi]OEH94119.1 hypothetical protein BFG57_09750 [Bacillus solimangrovi]